MTALGLGLGLGLSPVIGGATPASSALTSDNGGTQIYYSDDSLTNYYNTGD